MANLRISQLPAATTVVSTDILPFTDISASETKKIAMDDLAVALGILGTTVGSTQPSSPTVGQLWVDTGSSPPVIKLWTGTVFQTTSFENSTSIPTSPGTNAPTNPPLGKLWLDTSTLTAPELKAWNGSNWKRVDPDGQSQSQNDARYLKSTDAASTYLPLAGGVLTGDLTLDGDPTTNNMAARKKYVDDQISNIVIPIPVLTGSIIAYGGVNQPSGYLRCNGQAVSRSTFSDLFAVTDVRFGPGDGSTTFNVPDLRSEFIRGADNMGGDRGLPGANQPGGTQGDVFKEHNHPVTGNGNHTHTTSENGEHSHTYERRVKRGDGDTDQDTDIADDGRETKNTGADGKHTHSIASSGGHGHVTSQVGNPLETRPRNVAVAFLIKT